MTFSRWRVAACMGALALAAGCSDDGAGDKNSDSNNKMRDAQIVLSAAGATVVEGGSQIINVSLKEQPTADVELVWQTSDARVGTVSPSTMRFTPTDWSALKPLRLEAPQNDVVDGQRTWRVSARISSADVAYAQLVEPAFNVLTEDDDVAGFEIAPQEITTTEGGGSATFTIRLTAKPLSSVTIGVVSDDSAEGEASPSGVVFTPQDWDVAQTITVVGKDDGEADGDASYQIVFIAARSDDAAYSGQRPTPVRVTNIDGVCGNGVTDGSEACDEPGASPVCPYGQMSCMICGTRCQLVAGQLGGFCGDGVVQDAQESCDGAALDSCALRGATYGQTACEASCEIDESGCYEVEQLALGGAHSCALTDAGGVVCWGDGASGQKTPPANLAAQAQLVAGYDTTCAIDAAGAMRCWGAQAFALTRTNVAQVGVGDGFVCWIEAGGDLDCQGANDAGQATPPAGEQFTTIAVGARHVCGLRVDGSTRCWGDPANGRTTPLSDAFSALYAGARHTCGRRQVESTLECWGDNSSGQLNAPTNAVFEEVGAGEDFTCGRFMDGSLRCWGRALLRDATPPGNYDRLGVGSGHACARRDTGEVLCWGDEDEGQATPPARSI